MSCKRKKTGKKAFKIIGISFGFFVIICFAIFNILLSRVSNSDEYVDFVVEYGQSRVEIIENLKNAGLIKNKEASLIYVGIHNYKIQAGTYHLNRADNSRDILKNMSNGSYLKQKETINVLFIEGKRITDYASVISDNFGYDYDEVIKVFKDKEYAKTLIDKYSFLKNDILDDEIYYPLEGYLFPNKYSFYKDATVEEIIEKMLKETGNKLNSLQSSIDASGMSIHEILTKASIVEAEGTNASNRAKISQVIDKRISINMNLGMDVTTYYAVQKPLTSNLSNKDLASTSKYNTRLASNLGLPIGPICNPSLESITAALNPSNDNYIYFYASKDGTIKFTDNYDEFLVFKKVG